MKRSLLVPTAVLSFIAILVIGCTSSSTPTAATNPGYSSQYGQPTRSGSQYGTPTQQPQTAPKPKATLMLFSFETGDIQVGKGYNIYAVADNPDSRILKYKWEVTGGALNLVADSDKDTLNSEIKTALAPPAAPAAPETGAAAGATPGTSPAVPPAGTPATPPTSAAPATPSGASANPAPSGNPAMDAKQAIWQQWLKDNPNSTTDQKRQRYQEIFGGSGSAQGPGGSTPPTSSQGSAPPAGTARLNSHDLLHSSLVVLGLLDEPKPDDTKKDEAKPAETKPAENAQPAAKSDETKPAETAPTAPAIHSPAVREGGPVNRANRLGDLGVSSKTTIQSLSRSEASAKRFSSETSKQELVTDDPFVSWTPDKDGKATVKCTILSEKAKPLTDTRTLDVTVSAPIPVMTVDWEKADRIKAEDYVYVDVRVANIPDFTKALFNVNYDKDKFLFKYAKLGDFFPSKDSIDFYYAQPNKDVANITGAISYNVLSRPLKGGGIIAQLVFKAKDNLNDVTGIKFSQNEDAAFKYVLDDTGTNILPAFETKPIPATERLSPQTPAAPATPPTAGLPATPLPPAGATTPVTPPTGGTLTPPLQSGQQPAGGGAQQNPNLPSHGNPPTSSR